MEKGYVQIYTGDGKGKTTAALGLGLRAVGSGFRVIMFQFLKGSPSGELKSVTMLGKNFEIIRLAESKKFFWTMNEQEKNELKKNMQGELEQVRKVLVNKECDLLILDEIMAAIHGELLSVEDACALIDLRPPGMEMVLTGRSAPNKLIERADLVTEMRCIKHYMDKGVTARKGIEK
ncbi:MAG: cob(I)yrinic acid a,c-diamide adenosyltransferase [Firmicutes bacterium ML8_F2]|jgi:cob(I)alamin adenosyltransferase|nr:MAG: cob(I)yrinic acid a,c-diamide adenosyltransferase [Firmicutes bacterium ML8_F2]